MAEFVDQIPQQPGLAFEEKTHQYILNGMQVLPSVTTLMKPLSDTLYAGIRPETLQAAAERGTEVHSAIEDYVTLGITDISEARRGYFEAFLRWMKDYNVQPLSVEHRAYHPALGYAGTLDMAIKERESGMVNPNAEMVYDEEEGEYVLRPVKSAQTTLFDTEEKDNEQPGSPESAPSAPVAMLGDGSEESKQGHENDAYNVKFGPFDADDYDIQARKAIVDLLQGYGAKYEITDGGRFVECTISAMHIEDIKEQAESWVCGVERVPTEEKAAPAGKDDDAVDAEFHEVEENSENCAADNNPGKEAEDSDEAPEE